MATQSPLEDRIIAQVRKIAFVDEISADSKIISTGVVDSIGFVDLLNALEDEFSIKIDFATVTPEVFDTPRSIATFLGSRFGMAGA